MTLSKIEKFCDGTIVFALCAAIFVLPAAIAYLDSFIGLAVFFYLIKKIAHLINEWPLKAPALSFMGKFKTIWCGLGPQRNFLGAPLALLTLAIIVSVIMSQYPLFSLVSFFGKFVKSVFLYFCFIEVFSNKRYLRIFLTVLFISAFITILDAAYQLHTGKDFFKGRPIATENNLPTGRIGACLPTANSLGAYLLPVIALVVHFLFRSTKNKKGPMVAWLFFLALLLMVLCWTYSRSAWVGFLGLLLSMALLDPRKWILAGLLGVIFIFFFLPALNKVRHVDLINDSENSQLLKKVPIYQNIKAIIKENGSGRFSYWKRTISIIRSSPLYGTGLNTYTKIIQRNPDRSTWWYAHNSYLQMAAETGILGLGCFLWMMVVLFTAGLRACVHLKDSLLLSVLQGALCGLFSLLVQSFFDNTLYTVQLGMLTWFMIGLIGAVVQYEY